jgi:hypothetical protein
MSMKKDMISHNYDAKLIRIIEKVSSPAKKKYVAYNSFCENRKDFFT